MGAELDRAIARIAGRQHGVVTRRQLEAAGVERGAPSEYQRYMAAVLACGKGAVLSHQSAAYLWGFLKPEGGPVHVTSPSTAGKARRAGIVLHRSPSLLREGETTWRERIPVSTPRRTIEDLEGAVVPYLFRRAKSQAEFMKYRLKLPTKRTRSGLEEDFLRFLAKHGFPPPQVNVKVGKFTVDFLWPEQMLAVETDFFDYHRGHQAFEDDHQRDLELRLLGYTVRRYTGAQLDNYPDQIVVELGEVLGGRLRC